MKNYSQRNILTERKEAFSKQSWPSLPQFGRGGGRGGRAKANIWTVPISTRESSLTKYRTTSVLEGTTCVDFKCPRRSSKQARIPLGSFNLLYVFFSIVLVFKRGFKMKNFKHNFNCVFESNFKAVFISETN